MKDPRIIEPVVPGSTYKVPTFKVENEGITDGQGTEIVFCKGSKDDGSIPRQEGVFTETLLETSKRYLEEVNKGELSSLETSMAITKIDEALMWLQKRSEDRRRRMVEGTYKK